VLVVDTNVLVDGDSPLHAACRAWRAAWDFVAALLASPGLGVLVPTQRHAEVAGQVITELPHLAGNLLHDAHTAILMREHGIRRVCTRDTDH
jgi:predicted nucleic acid-binding protein